MMSLPSSSSLAGIILHGPNIQVSNLVGFNTSYGIGTGYLASTAQWQFNNNALDLTKISNSVTTMYDFMSNSTFTKFGFPSQVTNNIGLPGQTSLTKVVLPADVINGNMTNIDLGFPGCSSLRTVVNSEAVGSLCVSAFNGCSSMTTFGSSNTIYSAIIPDSAFEGCSSLTSIGIGPDVTSIGVNAFLGCSAVAEVRFMEGGNQPTIGAHAFSGTAYINNFFPNGVAPTSLSANEVNGVATVSWLPPTMTLTPFYPVTYSVYSNQRTASQLAANNLGTATQIASSITPTSLTVPSRTLGDIYFYVVSCSTMGETSNSTQFGYYATNKFSYTLEYKGATLSWEVFRGFTYGVPQPTFNVYVNGTKVSSNQSASTYSIYDLTVGNSYTFVVEAINVQNYDQTWINTSSTVTIVAQDVLPVWWTNLGPTDVTAILESMPVG
jgi:hypothetical protein